MKGVLRKMDYDFFYKSTLHLFSQYKINIKRLAVM